MGSFERLAHVFRHRPRDQQHIGMARGRDEADAKTLDVVIGIVQRVYLQLAAVAGASVDFADREAPAEAPPRRASDGGCELLNGGLIRRRRRLGQRSSEETL